MSSKRTSGPHRCPETDGVEPTYFLALSAAHSSSAFCRYVVTTRKCLSSRMAKDSHDSTRTGMAGIRCVTRVRLYNHDAFGITRNLRAGLRHLRGYKHPMYSPANFKGFAATLSSEPPKCGITWTTRPGNSSNPPATVRHQLVQRIFWSRTSPKRQAQKRSKCKARKNGKVELATWDIQQSVELAGQLKELGTDLIDCSSAGNVLHAKIPVGPGYQTQFAEQIRRQANILTGTVGMVTSPTQAEHILVTGQADAVVIAREFLRDPYWPLRAARELGQQISWPVQYLRAASEDSQARIPVDLENLESCFQEQHAIPER